MHRTEGPAAPAMSHLVGLPKAKLPTEMKCGLAKSRVTPREVQMPMWPMKGRSHVMSGIGVHTRQQGKLSSLSPEAGSTGASQLIFARGACLSPIAGVTKEGNLQ